MCRPLDLISEGSQQSNKGPYINYTVLVIGCFGTLVNKHYYSKDQKIGLLDNIWFCTDSAAAAKLHFGLEVKMHSAGIPSLLQATQGCCWWS